MRSVSSLHFALDFDGTVCPVDTTDFLLEAFAEPEWHVIEDRWLAGDISSRECLAAQIALIRASRDDIAGALDGLTLDPAVSDFVAAVRRHGAEISIVSDGFDVSILPLLAKAGLTLPVTSNRMVSVAPGRWAAAFSNSDESCGSGTCKCAATAGARRLVLVGDGQSDFCLAQRADFVLAKGRLADFCAAQMLPHARIASFADALALLPDLVRQMTSPETVAAPASFEGSDA